MMALQVLMLVRVRMGVRIRIDMGVLIWWRMRVVCIRIRMRWPCYL
jgi:hypothetical protein